MEKIIEALDRLNIEYEPFDEQTLLNDILYDSLELQELLEYLNLPDGDYQTVKDVVNAMDML